MIIYIEVDSKNVIFYFVIMTLDDSITLSESLRNINIDKIFSTAKYSIYEAKCSIYILLAKLYGICHVLARTSKLLSEEQCFEHLSCESNSANNS